MEESLKLLSGGVYQTILSDKPCKVIAFDEIEVFYDAYWPSLDRWTFSSSLKRKSFYYRTRPETFLRDALFLEHQQLTNDELKVLRPDLPFRVCRNKQLNWSDNQFFELEGYKQYAAQFSNDLSDEIILSVPNIVLQPFGPKGGTMKPATLSSQKDSGFSCIELQWLAHNIQAPHLREPSQKGVGIYRIGHEKNLPAYYIGGYYDAAGFIPKSD